jgi:hypothetical protein
VARIAHRPSPIAHRPSPIAHRPSPIAHRPSPIAHRPSPIAHRPSPIAPSPHRPIAPSPIATGGDLKLRLLGTPSLTLGDIFFLIVNNSFVSTLGTFATLNGTPFNPDNFAVGGQQFRISYTANFTGDGEFSDGVANDLALIAVPEPSTWMVLLAGGALAWGRRRRRVAKA